MTPTNQMLEALLEDATPVELAQVVVATMDAAFRLNDHDFALFNARMRAYAAKRPDLEDKVEEMRARTAALTPISEDEVDG